MEVSINFCDSSALGIKVPPFCANRLLIPPVIPEVIFPTKPDTAFTAPFLTALSALFGISPPALIASTTPFAPALETSVENFSLPTTLVGIDVVFC